MTSQMYGGAVPQPMIMSHSNTKADSVQTTALSQMAADTHWLVVAKFVMMEI
jgi:hypothetical protein